ncbi:staygreen family protein [Mesobacillus maritimus]|uniref:staygreen family protein n=1 Tax=Mesobacillus maritimus TaxID=1643336 RepID=UPI002040D8BA|nr:staygreen family protein [Mesobacillus maritimus]MCM3584220.1 staygreen family protein [Mesobacillus maritimus]MCM3669319.1 staygreen family protein [Mesobacillus maritimus]
MTKFNPNRLNVKYIPPVNSYVPIEGRKYTLTHSDETSELFLTIGAKYDHSAINLKLRDEVFAEWQTRNGEYLLYAKVYVSGGEFDKKFSQVRYMIFKKELELALTGIIYGDQQFLMNSPWLLDCPIFVHFESIYPEFNEVQFYGTPRQYLKKAINRVVSKTQA